jgi:predicted metal-binding protein
MESFQLPLRTTAQHRTGHSLRVGIGHKKAQKSEGVIRGSSLKTGPCQECDHCDEQRRADNRPHYREARRADPHGKEFRQA